MRHLTEDDRWQYVFDAEEFEGKADADAHLLECEPCRNDVAQVRLFHAALGQELPYQIGEDIVAEWERPVPERLQQLAAQIDDEHHAAREALKPLRLSNKTFQDAAVLETPVFQTTGAVEVLCEAAKELREREPEFALAVAKKAVDIATNLQFRGALRAPLLLACAETEVGAALFLIGRYRDSERALGHAEAVLDDSEATTGWHLANVWLVRANVCRVTERLDEARFLASAAARQFSRFGDITHLLGARLLQANVLYSERKFDEAATIAEEVIADALMPADIDYRARAMQTAAACYIKLGRYSQALPHLFEALPIWEERGLEVARLRTSWCLATIDVATGDLETGIRKLEETYRAFEALGVINDASLARMMLAEALLAAGRPAQVPHLLRNVVFNFASEGMMHNARIALAYLHEAVAQGRVEADVIRHVRTYLEDLPSQPSVRFAPLQ